MSSSAVFMTLISDVFPANMVGGMTGLWNAFGNIGGFVGPFVVGALMAGGNKLLGVGFLSVCYIIGALLVLFVQLRKTEKSQIGKIQAS
jgi:MFS family permease